VDEGKRVDRGLKLKLPDGTACSYPRAVRWPDGTFSELARVMHAWRVEREGQELAAFLGADVCRLALVADGSLAPGAACDMTRFLLEHPKGRVEPPLPSVDDIPDSDWEYSDSDSDGDSDSDLI
jgi:hypothetical protein